MNTYLMCKNTLFLGTKKVNLSDVFKTNVASLHRVYENTDIFCEKTQTNGNTNTNLRVHGLITKSKHKSLCISAAKVFLFFFREYVSLNSFPSRMRSKMTY